MVNFKLRRHKNDGRKKQESGYTLEYKLEASGKVDQNNPTQFGCALRHPGIEMIEVYSPEARGQSERAFGPHQGRATKRTGFRGHYRPGSRQPLLTRNPYTCFQRQVCLSGSGTRNSFCAINWRQSGGAPWTTQAGRLQPRRKETAPSIETGRLHRPPSVPP